MHFKMACRKFPFDIVDADSKIRRKYFPNALYALHGCQVGPSKYFLDPSYREHCLKIYNFQARKDDVFLVGYIRSGTTLHCEMVWLIGNDMDYVRARDQLLEDRFPHIDFCTLSPGDCPANVTLNDIERQTQRRFIKAHLPLSLLPPSLIENGSKVIYCARNPKDVIVSSYHAIRFFHNRDDLIESFAEYFKMVKMNWGYFLPYFDHVKEAWAKRNEENFLFLFYEDTIRDKRQTIEKIANFLDRKLTEDDINKLLKHVDIKNFKKNQSLNLEHYKEKGLAHKNEHFIRKGGAGGWKEYFVGELAAEADQWISENLKDSDLRFPES